MHLVQRSPALLLALLLAASRIATGQDLASLPECGQTCVNSLVNAPANMGCEEGGTPCLCGKPDFQFAIRDCAEQACPADVVAEVTNFATALCATATEPPPADATTPSSEPPTPPPATSEPPSSTTPSPSPSPSSTSTPTSDPATTASNTTPTSSPSKSSTASLTTSTSAKSSAATSPTKSASPDTTSGSSSTTTTSAAAETTSASSGLSVGAKAGIGIGAAAAVAGVIAAVVFCTVRRRQRRAVQSTSYLKQLQISDPMPGSGRSYAGDSAHSPGQRSQFEMGLTELESRSRRYEDMLPREKPRYVV